MSVVHEFRGEERSPVGALVSDGRGNLYGMTANGGAADLGTLFTILPDGTGYRILHEFAGGAGDGALPAGALVPDRAGHLYGVTSNGGVRDYGTVFRIREDGGGFEVLLGEVARPMTLVLAEDGVLYGTSLSSVFRVGTDGSNFAVLHSFRGGPEDGRFPRGPLVVARGVVYGATDEGGQPIVSYPHVGYYYDGDGTVFSLRTDGSGFRLLHRFARNTSEGLYLSGGLASDESGALFGFASGSLLYRIERDGAGFQIVTSIGPEDGWLIGSPLTGRSGEVFADTDLALLRMRLDGSTPVPIHRSWGALDGSRSAGITLSDDGSTLYRTMTAGGEGHAGALSRIGTDGTGFALIHSFPGFSLGGHFPNGVTAAFGALYGTALEGGRFNGGVVFTMRKTGSGFTVLHAFDEGEEPTGRLASDALGRLFGSSSRGGENHAGAVFRMNADGSDYRILKSFSRDAVGRWFNPNDLLEKSGRLYGASLGGGTDGAATIFSLAVDGNDFRILYEFPFDPVTGLWGGVSDLSIDASGNLYGLSFGGIGGTSGAIFSMRPDGTQFRVLHVFTGGRLDGWDPAALVLASDGVLVGATRSGGESGTGVLFRIGTDGSSYGVLHSLNSGRTGAGACLSALITRSGSIWGETSCGGPFDGGTLFQFAPDGPLRILFRFGYGAPDGFSPGTISLACDGELVGTSWGGYSGGIGTVFALSDGLARPATGGSGGALRRP